MEMESGSVPLKVLLSKGSKISSLMLLGCRTYPHWPPDMNRAWFICMGLSGEHRQERQEVKETLCTFHKLDHHPHHWCSTGSPWQAVPVQFGPTAASARVGAMR